MKTIIGIWLVALVLGIVVFVVVLRALTPAAPKRKRSAIDAANEVLRGPHA